MTDAPAPVPQTPPVGFDARRRFGWVFAAVWLFFLAEPFEDALAARDRGAGVLAVVALAAFAVTYVALWVGWQRRRFDPARGQLGWREGLTGVLVLVVLAALAFPGAGQSAANTFVFVCAYGMFALPVRGALTLVGLVVLGLVVASRVDPAWSGLLSTAAGTVLAALATFGISRMFARTRELALAHQDLARLAVAEERGRFARDLHDLLGHSLTVITLKSELAGRLIEVDAQRAAAEITDVERLSRQALTDVRAALEGYRDVSLATELAGARQALAAAGITAHLPGAVEEVGADDQELFGWVVREGVTNVVRHSGASSCWIEVEPSGVAVCDDGAGPRPGSGGGRGLTGLADRARSAGGRLTVGRSAQGGFRLEVRR
ncbi:sensor histidine kinase [Kineococcus gynurae]|uniref:Sensor histidine kinase n=1 Tax=Kineococcus gynurae TaxID=452979 RepID=A0ABV5LQ77_9ACTN